MHKPELIGIVGPTAVGKTRLAAELARALGTEVISADARQFYAEMRIGTARPLPEELLGVPHHLLGHRSIHQNYSVGDYEREALAILERLFQNYSQVVLVGGSGLYVKALLSGLDTLPEVEPGLRAELQARYQHEGLTWLQAAVQQADPDYYAQADIHNPQRLLRALEIYRSTGKPASHFRQGQPVERTFRHRLFRLELPREELYARINQRVDLMISEGLVAEAQALFPYRHLNALRTVGYSELFAWMEGHTSLEEAIDLIKRNTRRYAKRQETWFRNQHPEAEVWHPQDLEGLLSRLKGE